MKQLVSCCIVTVTLLLSFSPPCLSQLKVCKINQLSTWIVDDEADGDFNTLQRAVNKADIGDIIKIYSGTYSEHVVIKKQIILQGIPEEYKKGNDTGKPIIDGCNRGNVLVVKADDCEISGLRVVNSGTKFSLGAGIKVISNNCLILGNTVENNFIGISFESSQNSTIKQNTVLYNIFGIYLNKPLNCNIIQNNLSNSGLIIVASAKETLSNTIINNTINNKPYSVYINANNTEISNTVCGEMLLINCHNVTIKNLNISNTSVGLIIQECTHLKISNNSFKNIHRGAISLQGENCEVDNNTFYNCSYGCYLEGGKNFYLHHNNFFKVYKHDYPTMSWIQKHQTFTESTNITFNNNYWDDWIGLKHSALDFLPKIIPGFRKAWHKTLNIFPVFVFDNNPALDPF